MKVVDITPEQAAQKLAALRAARRSAAHGRRCPIQRDPRQASVNARISIRSAS